MSRLSVMRDAVRAAPVTVVALPAVAAIVAVAAERGGYPTERWTALALLIVGLLAVCLLALWRGLRTTPGPVWAAVAGLAAFAAWSYLSILWAVDQGAAWEGANRTLLYLLVLALFGLWRQRPETAAVLVGAWALAIAMLAVVTAVRVHGAEDLGAWFLGDRLFRPAGYANAAACMWLMALWPCVALAAAPRMPALARGVFAGATVVLVAMALLSLSRGAVLSAPFVLVLFFLVVPGRLRHLALCVPIGAGLLAAGPVVLDVGPAIRLGRDPAEAVDTAIATMFLAAGAVAVLVAAATALVRRTPIGAAQRVRIRRGATVGACGALAVAAVGGLVAVGSPVARVDDAWTSFRGGYEARAPAESRLTNGLGSNRYDFYRVAVDVFAEHPVRGVGADNFQAEYLRAGRGNETPRYPHSWPLRTLSELGLVGALVLLGFLGAVAWAARRALRRADPLAVAVAGGGLFVFVNWLAHGAGDWFWEYAGLGAPAFAMLGLALALVGPRLRPELRASASGGAVTPPAEASAGRRRMVGGMLALAVVAGAGGLGATLAAPWLADREVTRAAETWPQDPLRAFQRLDRAARLDPLAARPYLVAATISLRRRSYTVAERYFAAARARNRGSAYAVLELGALASRAGRTAQAVELLRQAVRLDPRDDIAARALRTAARGGVVDVERLNTEILARSRALGTI